jgi:NAD(P)H-hydrate epimerase
VDLRQVPEDPQETLTWALLGASLTVDGLLGTGSSGPLRGVLAEAVRQVNAAGTPVLAIDLPSGLEASGGGTNRDAVRADDTVMLAIPKRGCLVPGAHALVGQLWLADIGVPAQAYRDSGLMPPLFSADGLQRYGRSS